jgi:hypothetical protein
LTDRRKNSKTPRVKPCFFGNGEVPITKSRRVFE